MDDEVKRSLDDIFAKHKEAKAVRAVAAEKVISAEEKFKADFETAADEIIVTDMNEIGEYLKTQGYDFRIEREQDRVTDTRSGKSSPALVRLVMITSADQAYRDRNPTFAVIAENYSKKVRFHESLPSMSGPAGEATLDGLTKATLQSKILGVVAKAFK